MSDLSIRLRKLAIRMRDVRNLTDEDTVVDPNGLPGMLTNTLGGPSYTKHRTHDYESPLGLASVEEEEEEDNEDGTEEY